MVCRVFVDLMQAIALSVAKATPEAKVERITQYLRAEWKIHLEFLGDVTPAARNRGMLLYIGENQSVYAGDNIRTGRFNSLGGRHQRLAAAISRADRGKPAPPIHTFCVDTARNVHHGRLEWTADRLPLSILTVADAAHPLTNCRDIWATRGTGNTPEEVYFYTAHGDDVRGYVLGGDNKARFAWSEPFKDRRAVSIRAVQYPESIPNDPDDTDQKEPALHDVDWIVYVGCQASADVFVKASDQLKGYLPIPPSWTSYTGIGVDQTYLWIFRPEGFACVTHTSLIQCVRRKRAQPSWITHSPDDILYKGDQHRGARPGAIPPLKGLVDLFPCEDGTLVAAAYLRTIARSDVGQGWQYDTNDDNILSIGDYHTDLARNALYVTWRRVEDNQALQVHKVPMSCWPLIEGTTQSLTAKLARGVAKQPNVP